MLRRWWKKLVERWRGPTEPRKTIKDRYPFPGA